MFVVKRWNEILWKDNKLRELVCCLIVEGVNNFIDVCNDSVVVGFFFLINCKMKVIVYYIIEYIKLK